jgi:hypothetical protein
LVVLGVNNEQDHEAVSALRKKEAMTYPTLVDGDAAFRSYGISSIPRFVLVGRDGVVRKAWAGWDPQGSTEREIREAVEAELAATPPG